MAGVTTATTTSQSPVQTATTYAVLLSVAASHMLNDTLQAVMLSMYPLLHQIYSLSFAQVGMMTMVFQVKDKTLLDKVKAGDAVRFNAEMIGGQFTVTQLERAQ